MSITRRVYARYVASHLDVGRGAFTDHLKIHRYRESVEITDLENAGKRGKRVRILMVSPGYVDTATGDEKLKKAVEDVFHMNYDEAKRHLEQDGTFRLTETEKRGVDIEPAGTKVELENKSPDGRILEISATPHNFLVKDSALMGGVDESGRRTQDTHFRQDTLYWPASKKDGIVFYSWLKSNLSRAGKLDIHGLTKVWDELGVRYDSH